MAHGTLPDGSDLNANPVFPNTEQKENTHFEVVIGWADIMMS
jgi:hypothetical protein